MAPIVLPLPATRCTTHLGPQMSRTTQTEQPSHTEVPEFQVSTEKLENPTEIQDATTVVLVTEGMSTSEENLSSTLSSSTTSIPTTFVTESTHFQLQIVTDSLETDTPGSFSKL